MSSGHSPPTAWSSEIDSITCASENPRWRLRKRRLAPINCGRVSGEPFSIADPIRYFASTGLATFTTSRNGALVYQANRCGTCHVVNGVGMKIGPPLNGLSKRETRSWVEEHFAAPEKLSPGSIMPPYQLGKKDLENLTSYLFALPE